jgi:hypothetical protein
MQSPMHVIHFAMLSESKVCVRVLCACVCASCNAYVW